MSYFFPPAGGPGVQRILKFVKYLPQFGWNPVVLTATPETYLTHDETLVKDISKETLVYRVPSLDIERLRPKFDRMKMGKALSAFNVALMLPDATLFWARQARPIARSIIEQHSPALLLSSSPPPSTHRLALWLHGQFGLPWVTDFRDPWSTNAQTRYYPGYRAVNRQMEREVLENCEKVITVSTPISEMLQNVSEKSTSRISIIENGYDEDDTSVLPPPKTQRFTISYAGIFSRMRRPDPFVAAVKKLIDSRQIPVDSIYIPMAGMNTMDFVPDYPPFKHLGYLRHESLNELRKESNLLLLILGDSLASRGNYSGKLFEHLGCNRPTLCITHPDNVAAKLIVRAKAGIVVRPQPEEISQVILDSYQIWKSGEYTYSPDWSVIQQYTRKRLTQRLSDIFSQVVTEAS